VGYTLCEVLLAVKDDVVFRMSLGWGVWYVWVCVGARPVTWACGGIVGPGPEAVGIVRIEGMAHSPPEYGGGHEAAVRGRGGTYGRWRCGG
jgi:hypothetical protein